MDFKKGTLVRVIEPSPNQQGKWYRVLEQKGKKVTVQWVVSGSPKEHFEDSELTQKQFQNNV